MLPLLSLRNQIQFCQLTGGQPTTTTYWQLEKVPSSSIPSIVAPIGLQRVSPLPQDETSLSCGREVAYCGSCYFFKKKFLHDAASHQGTEKTQARVSDFTYWVGIVKDSGYYCANCEMVKVPARPPAPLQLIVTSRSWKLVAVESPEGISTCWWHRIISPSGHFQLHYLIKKRPPL